MDFIISAATDIGIKKHTNQDSFSVKTLSTPQGKMVFAVICDGMGGLEKGEVASTAVVQEFIRWIEDEFQDLCSNPLESNMIQVEWEKIVERMNQRIALYGRKNGVRLGTTLTVMLMTQSRYYIMNVGDSRAYEINQRVSQLTKDQTLINREVELGNLTKEDAKKDLRRSILLQCVGASDVVVPDYYVGEAMKDATYLLCTDGFRHEITEEEILQNLRPQILLNDDVMERQMKELIELNKLRQEMDNISVILVRTF